MNHVTDFSLALSDAARQRRAAELLVREAAATFQQAERRHVEASRHRFSIVRTVQAMASTGLDGIEREVAQEMAHQAGRGYDSSRVLLPWGALMGERAMIVGTAASGGYLADGLGVTIGEALAGYSVAFDAGITTLGGLQYDAQIAQEAASGTGYWLAEATGTATASAPTFAAASLTPKHAGGYVEISRQLLKQSPGVDAFVGRSLRRTIGKLLDAAIISGTGTTEPQGLNGMTGITVSTGTSLAYADVLAEQEAIADAYVTEANHKFIGSPDVRTLLAARDLGTDGGRYLWDNDRIVNRPAFATPACGTQTLVHGDFSQAVLALWGPGVFELQVNPVANFRAGIVGMRVIVSCDLAVLNTDALRVIEGIT